ncbi:Acyl-coenzyme A oxidase [Balamuthia mandrillaris]
MSLSQQTTVALRRAAATCRHLHGERSATSIEEGQEQLGCASTSAVGELAFDPAAMSLLMLPRNREDLHKVWQLAKEPLFAEYQPDLSLSEQRDLCFRRMKRVVEAKIFSVRDLETDPHRFCNVMAALSLLDMSVVVKFAAQYSLMGGGLLSLGSQRHQHLVDAVTSLDLLGCFAMSELGHGSDVRGLETTATYDPQTKEFIIHTPTTLAQKYWIGGALTAEQGIVFAQLVMPDGTNHGIHTFICPIHRPLSAEARSTANLETVPGVTVTDVGVKLGLNGVDNGCIRFDRVRVPRENLLDRFGNVDENGVYSSPISDPVRRFAAHLVDSDISAIPGELVGGRVLLQAAGTTVAKQGLIIATRYALSRTQFGVRLMDYLSHQRRLLPLIAEAYAHTFINNFVIHRYIAFRLIVIEF